MAGTSSHASAAASCRRRCSASQLCRCRRAAGRRRLLQQCTMLSESWHSQHIAVLAAQPTPPPSAAGLTLGGDCNIVIYCLPHLQYAPEASTSLGSSIPLGFPNTGKLRRSRCGSGRSGRPQRK